MNDPHAHYEPFTIKGVDGPIGGFAKARFVMESVRSDCKEQERHVLTLLAGDLLMGTPFSAVFKGRAGVHLMNLMNFDAMAVGNHEFDYGKDHLLNVLKPMAKFPMLSLNITTDKGELLFEKAVIKEFPGSKTRAIIFGLTTPDTPVQTMPDNVKGLVFHDPIKTAKEFLEGVDDKDLVIAVTHLGRDVDRELAKACPKIDVIIGGHSHTWMSIPERQGETLICQAGAYAQNVGQVYLDVVDGKVVKHWGELQFLKPELKEDPTIAAVVADYRKQLDARYGEVIGTAEVFLDGSMHSVRSGITTNLGSLITYSMASAAGADLALLNGGAIRSGIMNGPITLGDVYTTLPFEDTLVKITLSGSDLVRILQRSQDIPPGTGGKLQTWGITTESKNGKVNITKIRDRDFRAEGTYSVAINNFLFVGGDGYVTFKEKGQDAKDTGLQVTEVFLDFVKKRHNISGQELTELTR